MLNYRIRLAELSDLARCVEIDASYITTYVWQMQESFEDPALPSDDGEAGWQRPVIVGKDRPGLPSSFRLELQPSRLPRPLAVAAPLGEQALLAEWKKTDYLLVAETVETLSPLALPSPIGLIEAPAQLSPETALAAVTPTFQSDVLGYIGLRVDGPRHTAWITTQAVQLDYRRQGVGSRLLSEARDWADRYRLRSLLVELQTKNFPAINFYQKQGFFFCGYNSAFYANREVALFFGKRLEKFS